jgi:hypothetical protein
MEQLTEIYHVRFSKQQAKSLEVLKKHNVVMSKFIRQAVKEKIQRDWKNIKTDFDNSKKEKIPF